MIEVYFLVLYFFTYGFLGWCTEVAYATTRERRFVNRGFLNGPICPIYGVGVSVVIYFLSPLSGNMAFLYIASTVLVTVLEGVTGYVMDRIFHHKWWDYSGRPLNIGGYVCLLFSLVWGGACVAIVKIIHPVIYSVLSLLPFTLGLILECVLGAVLFADLYVTASGILKFNRQLEAMERIAGELRELSDKLGESIHENVMETIEATAEQRKKLEEVAEEQRRRGREIMEELKERREELKDRGEELKSRYEELKDRGEELKSRYEELKTRYEELALQRSGVAKRLMAAFPRMESRHHRDILEELKERFKNRL